MRTGLTMLLGGLVTMVSGCVWEMPTHEIRVRPTIADVENRVLSFELVVPHAAWGELVVYHGIFTAAELKASQDTLKDFHAGYAHPAELEGGKVKLIVIEAGQTRVIQLPKRAGAPHTLYISVTVAADVSRAEARWATDEGGG